MKRRNDQVKESKNMATCDSGFGSYSWKIVICLAGNYIFCLKVGDTVKESERLFLPFLGLSMIFYSDCGKYDL
jgi:hypothetical protein